MTMMMNNRLISSLSQYRSRDGGVTVFRRLGKYTRSFSSTAAGCRGEIIQNDQNQLNHINANNLDSRHSESDLVQVSEPQRDSNLMITKRQPGPGDLTQSIKFTDSETDGSQSYISEVRRLATNIPRNVRESFSKPMTMDDLQNMSKTVTKMDSLITSAKQTCTQLQIGPSSWRLPVPIDGYSRQNNSLRIQRNHNDNENMTRALPSHEISLVSRKGDGQTAAYHYPHVLIPRDMGYRFPMSMLVDPVFASSVRDLRLRQKPQSLWPRLQGKVTFMVVFSGQPLSSISTGLAMWRRIFEEDCLGVSKNDSVSHLVGYNESRIGTAPKLAAKIETNNSLNSTANLNDWNSNSNGKLLAESINQNSVIASDASPPLTQDIQRDLMATLGRQPVYKEIKKRELLPLSARKIQLTDDGSAAYGESEVNNSSTQFLQLHCCEGWFSRRTSYLTKFLLRSHVQKEDVWNTFVYNGKWNADIVESLQLYNKELPTCLLIDGKGYIRWHAIGLPNDDSKETFIRLCRKLRVEKK